MMRFPSQAGGLVVLALLVATACSSAADAPEPSSTAAPSTTAAPATAAPTTTVADDVSVTPPIAVPAPPSAPADAPAEPPETSPAPPTTSPTATTTVPPTATTTVPPTATTTEPPTTITTVPPTTTTTEPPADVVIVVALVDGRIEAESRYEASLGDTVEVRVTSDVVEEVHLHGYDLLFDLEAGAEVRVVFEANLPGVWEAELHPSHRQFFQLKVS